MATCAAHRWTKRTLPCPYLQCEQGARGLWVAVKGVVYVRRRTKDERGPTYDWEKTTLNPNELVHAPDEEESDIVF